MTPEQRAWHARMSALPTRRHEQRRVVRVENPDRKRARNRGPGILLPRSNADAGRVAIARRVAAEVAERARAKKAKK